MVKEVKFHEHDQYAAYVGSYLGNYYFLLTFPELWQYELFETIINEKMHFSTNYEPYEGRKEYAHETAGGFYTVRLACLEQLQKRKRQASVLALRFINPREYIAPLGVWVTLEAARRAILAQPIVFSSKELLLNYTRLFVRKKFGLDVTGILQNSILLQNIKTQKRLTEF